MPGATWQSWHSPELTTGINLPLPTQYIKFYNMHTAHTRTSNNNCT